MSIFIYFLNCVFCRFLEFFQHWYADSFRFYSHFVISLLEKLDRKFAFRITLKYIFKPLYQDRSFIGYILGFIFRSGRLILSGFIYLILLTMAIILFFGWSIFPFYIIYKIVKNLII